MNNSQHFNNLKKKEAEELISSQNILQECECDECSAVLQQKKNFIESF